MNISAYNLPCSLFKPLCFQARDSVRRIFGHHVERVGNLERVTKRGRGGEGRNPRIAFSFIQHGELRMHFDWFLIVIYWRTAKRIFS